jgi:hypothetical protein
MAPVSKPRHFVVDGSNIATEGRTQPSLLQLNEAVMAFMDDYPGSIITVVVDATFGHRIDSREVKDFDEAVANNELVTPPAGAIGRGDAFVLTIANKANADVLSNDSFQEFHGKYEWLFDEGRLIGGKPVPHVGWVFVDRNPVRGPKSRMAVRDAKKSDDVAAPAPRGRGRSRRDAAVSREAVAQPAVEPKKSVAPMAAPPEPKSAPPGRGPVNELMPFLEFVEKHPVGTSCTAVVEIYASHGAYARVGEVLVYIPLRLMGDPAPRSARATLNLGDALAVVIVGYVAERRSIDAALPAMATAQVAALQPAAPVKKASPRKQAPKRIAETAPADPPHPQPEQVKQPSRRKPVAAAPLIPNEIEAKPRKVAARRAAKPAESTIEPQQAAKSKPSGRRAPAAKPAAVTPDAPSTVKPVKKAAPKKSVKKQSGA